MADQRITELTELGVVPAAGDWVVVVDIDASGGAQTKKISFANFGAGGGASTLAGLDDVDLTSQTTGDLLFNVDGTNWEDTEGNLRIEIGDFEFISNFSIVARSDLVIRSSNGNIVFRNDVLGGGLFELIVEVDGKEAIRIRDDGDAQFGMRSGSKDTLLVAGVEVILERNGFDPVATTLAATAGGLSVNNTLTGAGFERVLTLSDIGGAQTPWASAIDGAGFDLTGAGEIQGELLQATGPTVAERAILETNNANLGFPRGVFTVGSTSGDSITNAGIWFQPDTTTGNFPMLMEVIDQGIVSASSNRFGIRIETTIARLASSMDTGGTPGPDIGITTQGIISTDYDIFIDESTRIVTFSNDTQTDGQIVATGNVTGAIHIGDEFRTNESSSLKVAAEALSIKGGAGDHVFMGWYADAASQGTRSAFMGFGTPGADTLLVTNQQGTLIQLSNETLIKGPGTIQLTLQDSDTSGVGARMGINFVDSIDASDGSLQAILGSMHLIADTGGVVLNANTEVHLTAGTFTRVTGGSEFRFYDSTDTDYAAFVHDGTDFNTTFVTTTDWNITVTGLNLNATNIGFYGTTPAAQSAAYARNATIVEDRTLLASASATTINNNNVLAALIADLQATGLIG